VRNAHPRSKFASRTAWIASLTLGTLALALVGPGAKARPLADSPASETITLFDGKTLDGWDGDVAKYWSVVDGTIVGKNTKEVPVSTYLFSKRKFTDFRLTAKVKLVTSKMHSGIAFWGKQAPEKGDPYTYMGHLVMFPLGWGMYDLHRRGGLPVDTKPAKAASKGDYEWNDLEILATGHRVRVAVNGKPVVDFKDPKPELVAEGPIALQLHSNKEPQEVHFKDLVVETFPKEDKLVTVKAP
jgi:hypothetical protein